MVRQFAPDTKFKIAANHKHLYTKPPRIKQFDYTWLKIMKRGEQLFAAG
jgi:hypothetical protein